MIQLGDSSPMDPCFHPTRGDTVIFTEHSVIPQACERRKSVRAEVISCLMESIPSGSMSKDYLQVATDLLCIILLTLGKLSTAILDTADVTGAAPVATVRIEDKSM